MATSIVPVSVSNLLVDNNNPRFDPTDNQRAAIQDMLEAQGDKVLRLAKHIAEHGLNPSELALVTKHPEHARKFIVLEGNRRITALKLLAEPDLAGDRASAFRQAAKSAKNGIPNAVNCSVVRDRDAAREWIRLRHTGENAGIGIVRWDADAVRRFETKQLGKNTTSLEVLDFADKHLDLDAETKRRLKSVAITNLERLIEDDYVLEFLGLHRRNGSLQGHVPVTEIKKGLSRLVSDLAYKRIKVRDIYYKKDRKNYLEKFKPDQIPNTAARTRPWSLTNPAITTPAPSAPPALRLRSKALAIARKNLIPPGTVIRISEKRVNTIYRELKEIDLASFTNAGAVLLRVFVELSADHYLAKLGVTLPSGKDKLHHKIGYLTTYLEQQQLATKAELKGIRVASVDDSASTNTLNAYVHNRHFSPKADDLKITWDNIEPFVVALWK